MGKVNYYNVEPVGQYDGNACWAACLEWWLAANNLGKIYQDDVFDEYPLLRYDNGTISREGLITLINDPRWYMKYEPFYLASYLTKAKLKEHLKAGPVYIGYFNQHLGNYHVNCIFEMKSGGGSNPKLWVMEPMAERTSPGSTTDLSYRGKHVKRNLKYYTAVGECYVGSPASVANGSGESYTYEEF